MRPSGRRASRAGDWLCNCHGCRRAAEAHAHHYPDAPLILKRSEGRDRITFADWVAADYDAGRWLTSPADYVREVFVGEPGPVVRAHYPGA